jgi:iron complex transport system substrate-binding protein
LLFFSFIFLLVACNGQPPKESLAKQSKKQLVAQTAHFSLHQTDTHYELRISEPFAGSSHQECFLLYYDSVAVAVDSVTHTFQLPLHKLAINSTTHLGFLKALGKAEYIMGASHLDLFYDSSFQVQIASDKVIDLGKQRFDQEKVLASGAEVLFSFSVSKQDYQQIERFRDLGVKVVSIAEYLEANPLDKAKWMIAFAAFFGKEAVAEAIAKYQQIEFRYDSLQKLADQSTKPPTVLLSLPWKGTWYVGGGESFQASFLADANANYLWADHKQKGSIPLDMEMVIKRGLRADYWLNPGASTSYQELLAVDERFKEFQAFKEKRIYNLNKRVNQAGGNDYWESAVCKPEVVLGDLIQILHPELLPKRELYYYKPLSHEE